MEKSGEAPRFIGLTGKIGSGKDTVGEILAEFGYERTTLATPIRQIAKAIGWTGSKEELRDCPCCGLKQGRQLLQALGTEGLRSAFGEDVLVKWLLRRLDQSSRFVVTDVRFPTEADAIKRAGGQIWKVERTPQSSSLHASERAVEEIEGDVSIGNNGSLDELRTQVLGLLGAG